MRKLFIIIVLSSVLQFVKAADPMMPDFSFAECEGSLRPYPADLNPQQYPDTLVPVMINHVGRHGSRYPASSANTLRLLRALERADSLGTITATGRHLMALTRTVAERSGGRWGALDSLGMAEHRAIATRMFHGLAPVFRGARVNAISSYSPRAMMSMYEFTHQLCRMDNRLEFTTTTGRKNSPLMRPFDLDDGYKDLRKGAALTDPYRIYFLETCPAAPIERALGKNYPFADDADKKDLSLTEYYVVAGCRAMMLPASPSHYFTREEYNALWSCFNLRQYLNWTATTVSRVPSDMASALLQDLISTFEQYLAGEDVAAVQLRFGHAETLMPLLSLMHLPGCYYMTNYFDTVALHWQDFNVVPMAANLQLVLFRNVKSGCYYLRTSLNEQAVKLIPGRDELYLPWQDARAYLLRCIPLYSM